MPTRIESLVADLAPLAPSLSVGEAFDWFRVHAETPAIPVVFERTVIGILTRTKILQQVSRLPSPSAASQPIMPLVDTAPARATTGQPLGEVGQNVAASGGKGFDQGILVTHGGAYYGYVSAHSLASGLSAENAQRARQMRLAADRLRTLSGERAALRRQNGQALARLGHEVRTPLTAMLGHTDRLLRQETSPEVRKSLDVIARASEALAELVSRSVEAGRLGAEVLDPKYAPFSPADLAAELGGLWLPMAADKGLDLDVAIVRGLPARLEGDVVYIRQILSNLISNALKFSQEGRVEVTLAGAEREEGQIAFTAQVRDTGPGIPPEHAARLFMPFERLAVGAAAGAAGTGLGLNIARGLARAMGGDVDYAPGPDGGSVFTLSLPLRRAGPRLAVATPTPRPQAKSRTAFQLGEILLIEDHAASRALIETTLESAGWKVDTVASLTEARRFVDQKTYQAILCDYFLRDGQGDVLIKMLRGREGPNRETLCLAVTADSSEARRRHCLAAGFAGVVTKPVRAADLITTLADFIASAEATGDPKDSLRA